MTPGHRKTLTSILNRVAEPGAQRDAIFLFEEVCGWPDGTIAPLIGAGLLEDAEPSDTITCRGCEERCLQPVAFLDASDGRQQVAISECHLFATMGPFEHPADTLRRWKCHREMIARFVGRQLGLRLKDRDERWRRVRYATLQVGDIHRAVSLDFSGTLQLLVGGSAIPLIEVMDWEETGISLDKDAVNAIAAQSNDLHSGNKRTQPSTSVQDDNKLWTQIRNRRLQQRLEKLAGEHPKRSKEVLVKRIEKSGEFPGMNWQTIARITRMPQKKSRRKKIA